MSAELTGRELDAAVGRALGFEPTTDERWEIGDDDTYAISRQEIWPAYSTDWAAAGLVIEAMQRRGRGVSLRAPDGISGAWFACFSPDGSYAQGETGPEAICRAALEAIR